MINLANMSAWTINIIRLSLVIMIVLSLAAPVMADLVINGSTTPTWINSSRINTTLNRDTTNIELRQQVDDYISYWRFDGSSGITVYDENHTSNNNGTLTNMNTGLDNGSSGWTSSGKYGNALAFDGSNDFVNCGNLNVSSNLTVIIWIKFTSTTEGVIINKWGTTPSWILLKSATTGTIQGYVRIGSVSKGYTTPSGYGNGAWHYVAMVYNSSNVTIYVDGNVAGTPIAATGLLDTSPSESVLIGRYTSPATGYFNGLVDEVRIYNRALSNDEINLTMNQSKYSSGYIKAWHNSTPNETYQITANGTFQTNSNMSAQYAQNGSTPSSFLSPANVTVNTTWGTVPSYLNTDSYFWLFGNGTSTPSVSELTFWTQAVSGTVIPANSSDLMFTVNASDQFNFTSNLTGVLIWQVNKVTQSNTTDGFLWTVPAKDNISLYKNNFEIVATNGTNTTEWLISTLDISEAPIFIDYLSDQVFSSRLQTDPWGRTLPTWTQLVSTLNATNGYFNAISNQSYITSSTNLSGNNVQRGTFKYWVYWNDAGYINNAAVLTQYIIMNKSPLNSNAREAIRIEKPVDGHLWLDGIDANGLVYNLNSESNNRGLQGAYYLNNSLASSIKAIAGWHNWTIIIDQNDDIYTYMDDIAIQSTRGHLQRDLWNMSVINYIQLELAKNSTGLETPNMDGFEVYNNTYLFPAQSIVYDSVSDEIRVKNGNPNENTTLQQINDTLNNVSLFNYFSNNNTYIAYKPLRILEGGTLRIINETFAPKTQIFLNNSANLYIFNSTIDSITGYYINYSSGSNSHLPLYASSLSKTGSQNITIINSTVNNSGFTSALSFFVLDIENSKFINMSTNFTVGQASSMAISNIFIIKNNSFDKNLYLNTINQCDLLSGYLSRHDYITIQDINSNITSYAGGSSCYKSKIEIKNSANKTFVTTSSFGGVPMINLSYYVDINVIDLNNNPINGIVITINNTVDSSVLPMNLNISKRSELRETATTKYEYAYYKDDVLSTIITDSSGHTPLPIGNESITLLLMNMTKNATTTTYYSYIANVNDSSYLYTNKNTSISNTGAYIPIDITASTIITPNSSWYRPNPNTYQNTTTITLPQPTNWGILPNITINVNASSDKNLTALWLGTAQVNFNTTIPEWASQTLYLKHDEAIVDTKDANITGFVAFSYTGLNGTFNVTLGEWQYNVSGFVNDSIGSPIEIVSIVNGTNSTTTNATGYYTILMTNGTYNFSYSKAGYVTGYKEIIVDGADVVNQNVTLTSSVSTSSIVIPTNSWGMFNNWSTYNTTFSGIAANESNDITYTYYNVSSGEWESYYIGYTYNQNNPIGQHNSVLGFFNAQTTITATTVTPSNTDLPEGWNMLYVEGSTNRTLTAIETDIETSPCTVGAIYSFNLTTQDYVSTGTESVQANQGFLAYIDSACTWTRTTI